MGRMKLWHLPKLVILNIPHCVLTQNVQNDSVLLRQWLGGLVFDFPPFEVPENSMERFLFTSNVTTGTCSNVVVDEIRVPSATGSTGQLEAIIHGNITSIYCSFETVVDTYWTLHNVTVSIAVAVPTFLLSTILIADKSGLPNVLQIKNCEVEITIINLKFAGSVLGWLLEAFEGVIRRIIAGSSGLVCDVAIPNIMSSGSLLLGEAAERLKPFLSPAEPLNVSDVPHAKSIDELLWSGPFGRGLRSGLRDIAHTNDMCLFNPFVDQVLAGLGLVSSDGSIHTDAVPDVKTSLPCTSKTMELILSISRISITNMSSFTDVFASVGTCTLSAGGAFAPEGSIDATVALSLKNGSASIQFEGKRLHIAETFTLSPDRKSVV